MSKQNTGKTFARMSRAESLEACAAVRAELNNGQPQKTTLPKIAALKSFSDIQAKPIEWLWPERFPLGKLSLIAGDPGQAKSQISLAIADTVSTGGFFPDGTQAGQGDTIILTSEDDSACTIKPRLEALGADCKRIHIIEGERLPNGKIKPITLQSIDTFKSAVDQIKESGGKMRLLIVDPMDGFFGDSDTNSNEQVRQALDAICQLAEKESFAIIGIKHLNKGRVDAQYKVGGSIAFTAKARAVYMTAKKQDGTKVFLPLKNNLAKDTGGFYYSITEVDTGGIIAPRIVWEGDCTESISSILNPFSAKEKEPSPEQSEILDVLQSGETLSTSAIASKTGRKESATSRLLHKLKTAGFVESPLYGFWRIVKPEVLPVLPVLQGNMAGKSEPVLTSEVLPPEYTGKSGKSGKSEPQPEPEIW
jgi:putative DNA primase/helicase